MSIPCELSLPCCICVPGTKDMTYLSVHWSMQPACRSGHKAKLFKKYGAPLGRQLCVHAAFVSCAKDGIEDRKEYPEEYYMNGKVSWSVLNWYEVRFEVLRSRVSSLSCGAQDILWQNFRKLVVVGIKWLPWDSLTLSLSANLPRRSLQARVQWWAYFLGLRRR